MYSKNCYTKILLNLHLQKNYTSKYLTHEKAHEKTTRKIKLNKVSNLPPGILLARFCPQFERIKIKQNKTFKIYGICSIS